MSTTLLALHGFTQNGAVMRSSLEELAPKLGQHVDLVCPDAPNVCEPESVDRMYQRLGVPRAPAPYLNWWNATDDGREYRGWEATSALLRSLVVQHDPVGVLGFSQGGMLALALAALAHAGKLPALRFAIIVAGGTPRADVFLPFFERKIELPSLHVWGERDAIAATAAPKAVEHFAPGFSESAVWPGPHVIPTRGPAAEAILRFVERHA